jgi:allantoicase
MNDFTRFADLASERLGGRVLEANDEFFAPKENLLKESRPIFIEGKYTRRGKWMDGWETRRRRAPGHDWCIVRLGLPGIIRGVVVDTSFFRGNYPERFSLEARALEGRTPYKNEKERLKSSNSQWTDIIPPAALKGDSLNSFSVNNEERFTHVRLKIYPDGGVARLRVYGEAVPEVQRTSAGEINLAGVENGGSVLASSDEFFGEPKNLLLPDRPKNMGDGWETRRRRGPGHDWVILKLGLPGVIRRIQVDTTHFKGNFPESCSLEACEANLSNANDATSAALPWKELLPRTKLKANHRHIFGVLDRAKPATHVRFNIYPDGGVARLRVFGRPAARETERNGLEGFNRLSVKEARQILLDCCGAERWAEQMLAQRPFLNVAQALEVADKAWSDLSQADWLEAFRHHPAIGATRASKNQSATARRWSAAEQSVAQQAMPETLAALAAANQDYRKRFGHVFLICATGKSSDEILSSLRERLPNDPDTELRIAAEEQRKITRLRLEKILAS